METGSSSVFANSTPGNLLRMPRVEQDLGNEDVAGLLCLPVDIVGAGAVRDYRAASIARIAIANPASVRVLHDGEPVDLAPFRKAEQARFALSSRGQPTPVRD